MSFSIQTNFLHFSKRPRILAVGCAVLLGVLATLSACHRQPSLALAPELAAIQCPADQTEHASASFGRAEIIFVCISNKLADTPSLLRCDLQSRPMICEDSGTIILSRSAEGKVYAGSLPRKPQQRDAPESESFHDSQLIVNFHNGPPRTLTFEEVETNWRFLLAGGKELLPYGFTFVKGTLCDRKATVLDSGVCNLEAESVSLYWHIAISVQHKKGTSISAEEYRTELGFWLNYLEKLIVDPKQ